MVNRSSTLFIFFFNDTATTEIYTLSLHDALPICIERLAEQQQLGRPLLTHQPRQQRSEEHTSELQSPDHLVCRLLLEKKNTNTFKLASMSLKYPYIQQQFPCVASLFLLLFESHWL